MNIFDRIYIGGKLRLAKFRESFKENAGMGTVEVILIIVVLIGLVIIFKGKIEEVVENIFETINDKTGEVN